MLHRAGERALGGPGGSAHGAGGSAHDELGLEKETLGSGFAIIIGLGSAAAGQAPSERGRDGEGEEVSE